MFLLHFLLSQLLGEAVPGYSKSCSSHPFRLRTPCLLTRWRSSYCPQRRAAAWLPPTTLPCWQYPLLWLYPLVSPWTRTPSQSSWHHTAKPLWLRTSLWYQCSLLGSWQQVGDSKDLGNIWRRLRDGGAEGPGESFSGCRLFLALLMVWTALAWFHCESLGIPYVHPLYGSLAFSSGDWECVGYSSVWVVVKSRCIKLNSVG